MGYPLRVAPPGTYLHGRTRATGRELLFRDDYDYAGMDYYAARTIARHSLCCMAY
jgi:hypothetical protein